MIRELLNIYSQSRVNTEEPKCLVVETKIFNEGWLLRGVLKRWHTLETSKFPFLPFTDQSKIYSEGQIYTPFKELPKKQGSNWETHTRADGLAGHFQIKPRTKTGIILSEGCTHFAVFEAKIYSILSKGTKKAPNFGQASRIVACMINTVIKHGGPSPTSIHFCVIYPQDRHKIDFDALREDVIRQSIIDRIILYSTNQATRGAIKEFADKWEPIMEAIQIHQITWEEILKELQDEDLNEYYSYCKQFC
jgi:hypothetical protein